MRPGVQQDAAALRGFLTTSARAFATHGSDIGDRLAALLTEAAPDPAAPPQTGGPSPPGLDDLLRAAPPDIARALAVCGQYVHWRKPGFGRLPAAVSDKIEVAEIVGPDALLPDRRIRFGLFLQQAGHDYPEHHHAAEELYFILAGRADWAADDHAPRTLGAGAFVHHAPWQPHAMTTGAEPMLALWGWTGEIDAGTYGFSGPV